MSLEQLPHELQLNVFKYLIDDHSALQTLAHASQHLHSCALEVLNASRILDLSAGYTDYIEDVLENLHQLANNSTTVDLEVDPQGYWDTISDNVVLQASRYETLKVCFDDREGATRRSPISRSNMFKFESVMSRLSNKSRYNTDTWRHRFSTRLADASLRLLLHTMRHITTLELGGSLSVLPWDLSGSNMLEMLRHLKLYAITNSRLSKLCCCLISERNLMTLEFSDMSITPKFLQHFSFSNQLSITSLRLTECWGSVAAITRMIKACANLETFEYSLGASHWTTELNHFSYHHLYLLLRELPTRALKHLTIHNSGVILENFQCNHVGSLVRFLVLESLTLDWRLVAPHQLMCRAEYGASLELDAFDILSSLAPSLQALTLRECEEASVIATLSQLVESIEQNNILPNLRSVRVTIVLKGSTTVSKRKRRQQRTLRIKFLSYGVKLRLKQVVRSG
ncbi:hypothetical protein N0V94_007012 [Neodidymelliopsis sp. IMI 364377]|nr:hypothetical protein N0V94_007012 [Neodidymelliopsis sp. IMI 364377]